MTFLLLRPSDQLLLGVAWTGMSVLPGGLGAPAGLKAGNSARITITLPPQHVSEQTSDPASAAPMQLLAGSTTVPAWQAALSGSSRLVIPIADGTFVPLTVEGMLRAVAERPVLTSAGGDESASALELPSRLTIAPAPGASVVCRHASMPALAPDATTGLWRTRLTPSDSTNGPIAVVATHSNPADPDYDLPLTSAQRALIVAATGHHPAVATRIEFSTLGGTLDIAGLWPDYQWEHHCVLGRDMKVRTEARGTLFPFGHRAQLTELTIRLFDSNAGSAAVLRTVERTLTITEPIRDSPADAATQRGFPFSRVQISTTTFTGLASPQWTPHTFGDTTLPTYFWPERVNNTTGQRERLSIPVVCDNLDGPLSFGVPMIFVADHSAEDTESLTDAALIGELARTYGEAPVDLPGKTINLVGSDVREDARAEPVVNSYEVHGISIAGLATLPDPVAGYRAALASMKVATPALRSLLGTTEARLMRYAKNYLDGTAEDVLMQIDPAHTIDIDFTAAADRCGALISPHYLADAISRTTGPVNLSALPAAVGAAMDPKALFPADATILGFSMRDLLAELRQAPTILSVPIPGRAPAVTMEWKGVKLGSHGGFVADEDATLDMRVKTATDASSTDCVLRNFGLLFPPGDSAVLALRFAAITYHQENGQPPSLDTSGVSVQFLGDLRLLEKLADAVDLGRAGRLVHVRDNSVVVQYTFATPPITGTFVMRNVAFSITITVPFDSRPTTVKAGFSGRARPFQLSVLMFGGSGYAEIELDRSGLRRFEAALDFGAIAAVDFVIARGEVYVLGGVRFTLEPDKSVTVTGYLRIGGSVDILGLVSVSIELLISLAYQSARNALVGRATLVITIDLTLWSDTMEIDSAEWVLGGGERHHRFLHGADLAFDGPAQWQLYRKAFFQPQRDDAVAPDHREQPWHN